MSSGIRLGSEVYMEEIADNIIGWTYSNLLTCVPLPHCKDVKGQMSDKYIFMLSIQPSTS